MSHFTVLAMMESLMAQNSQSSAPGAGRPQNRRRVLQVVAGVILSLVGAAGLAVTLLATFAMHPWSPPVLLFGIGSALLFTGGGVCLLMVGLAMILGGFQRRPTF